MKIGKKIIIYLLVGLLTCSSVSITYYKSVHAFEWVETGIATSEALKWLLGTLGIIGTAGALGDEYFWSDREEEFYEFVDENTDVPGPDVRSWLEKLSKGTLDKGSEVWNAFRSWAYDLVSNTGTGSSSSPSVPSNPPVGTTIFNVPYLGTVSDCINAACNYLGVNAYPISSNYTNVYACMFYKTVSGAGTKYYLFMECSDVPLKFVDYYLRPVDNSTYFDYFTYNLTDGIADNGGDRRNNIYVPSNLSEAFVSLNINIDSNTDNKQVGVLGWSNSGTVSSHLDSIGTAEQNRLDLISKLTGDDISSEVAIPLPGVSSGDDSISIDTYDGIIEKVNDGTITVDEAVEQIQSILKVLVYDPVTDDVIPVRPDPDDPTENEKKDDVIKDNKDNMGFTLAGLENVFPFCIPFDLYALLGILEADPQAPVFQFPFRDPKTKRDIMYTVDLSVFNPVAVVTRYGADLLFIFGLAIATRKLIGAGGGD